MISTLMLAAALAANPAETELATKLPEIFAKSAAHYKALDAAATPRMKGSVAIQGRPNADLYTPHGWNKWRNGKDELDMRSIYWWTSGHFPGSLWYLYEATGDAFFRDRATVWTEILAPNSKVTDNHDVGFIMYCSFGNARRLLKTDKYDALLKETAASLCRRYNENLGLIRSWGPLDEKRDFRVIPDNLMNLELLEAAARLPGVEVEKLGGGGQWNFDLIAKSHADVTMKHHFRADGGCFHVLDYDQVTKRVKNIDRGQGASCETAWSRGQSWAIYGYTMMYRMTSLVRYLDFAKKLADYAINHPDMPADGVPYWDYGAPGEERDTSAAAIMASGLLELSTFVDAADRARYRGFAVKQLLSLSSDAYYSKGGEVGHFLLKHGVGHRPGCDEVDTPLDYGDYYFLEALLRFRALKEKDDSLAALKATLPATATLPAEELLARTRAGTDAARAEAILKEPIPETTDALYAEYWETGNRTHYQERFFARLKNLDALVVAEEREGKGRYLPCINDYLRAFCEMRTWILPAHDWPEGGKGNYLGIHLTVDLFSSEVAANLACIIRRLGDRLDPKIVQRIKDKAERTVFGPLRRELPYRETQGFTDRPLVVRDMWWVDGYNNWNAVCWDNIVCAALGLLDDADDRAYFTDAALKSVQRYLEGFTPDGYCSEGMGYWNYGYGHHLLMGRLLRAVSGGRLDIFTTERQRKIAAYARAYTLTEGVSPAFSDGNGTASPRLLSYVDEIWPDLPKDFPPVSEFPDGQVWLVRDPKGLSVAFKGGHNDEFHNHNDVGSYYIVCDGKVVSGDPGGEEYTRFTFSDKRYDSKMNNSYGHPVPVVGGKLQGTGREFAAKVLEKKVKVEGEGEQRSVVVLDLTGAHDVKTLKKLTRTFVYDRTAKTFTVTDKVEFSAPTAFESPFNTYLKEKNPTCAVNNGKVDVGWNVRPEIAVKGGAYELVEEDVPNPNRLAPHRVAVRFKEPVTAAEVAFTYKYAR